MQMAEREQFGVSYPQSETSIALASIAVDSPHVGTTSAMYFIAKARTGRSTVGEAVERFVFLTHHISKYQSTRFACGYCLSSRTDLLELFHALHDRDFGGQAFDAARAEEADDAFGVRQNVLDVGRFGNRAAVAQH